MALPAVDLIDVLAEGGKPHKITDVIDAETASLVARKLGFAAELTGFALFDDNRLRTAVAEILPDMAALDRPLQRKRLAAAPAEGLVGGVLGFCHALLVKLQNSRTSCHQDALKPDR